MTKRILRETIEINPSPGDYTLLVENYCDKIGMVYDESFVVMKREDYKTLVNKKHL